MELGKRLAHALERATFERVAAVGLANAELNRPRIGRSILELADTASGGTARCASAGMQLFWWNPMVDDYERAESLSRRLHADNGLPCLNGGGNVGTAAWVVAHAVLGARRVGLVGIDFGYAPDTPYERTQYYPELREMLGERFVEAFVHETSLATGERWFSDP